MGVFVFLPLVLPLTAWPIARLAEQRLHPRRATVLLTIVAGVLAVCSTVCLGLLMVVGTAQLPGNPLPDAWSDEHVRAAVPFDEAAGLAAIPTLGAVVAACARTLWTHWRVRRRAEQAVADMPTAVVVLPDTTPYAYALPARHTQRGRVVVSTGMLSCLNSPERRVLFAHERAHLAGHHHRYLLTVQLAAHANPFLKPLRKAVAYTVERWADEEAASAVGNRKLTARAIGKAALVTRHTPTAALAHLAQPGPIPRRIHALLQPPPRNTLWPPALTPEGLATWVAAAGTTLSTLSTTTATTTLFVILEATTPL